MRYKVVVSQAIQIGSATMDRNSYSVVICGRTEDIPHKAFSNHNQTKHATKGTSAPLSVDVPFVRLFRREERAMAVFRIEKKKDFTVMSNYHFRDKELSLKAMGLLSQMLSLPDEWDYSLAGLAHISRDGLSSIRAAVNELEARGYLKRSRLRNEKGQLADTEYVILERPEPICENRTQAPEHICDFHTLENPTYENRTQLNTNRSNTQESNTYGVNINQINQSHPPKMNRSSDKIDQIDRVYRDIILENIDYRSLCDKYEPERVDSAVDLILETVLSKREYIRVAGDEFPQAVVKSRMLKLTSDHIEYAFDALDKNTTDVRNIKAYLLTTLFNAPTTIDSYFRARVNYDFYGGGT